MMKTLLFQLPVFPTSIHWTISVGRSYPISILDLGPLVPGLVTLRVIKHLVSFTNHYFTFVTYAYLICLTFYFIVVKINVILIIKFNFYHVRFLHM